MKKIIVVDNDYEILYTIKKVIEYYRDYNINTVDSGKKLFEALKKETPDLIILDITMPFMDGWDVHKILKSKSIWRDIPIIFISSVVDDRSIRKAKLFGDAFIEKPFENNSLLSKIDKFLIDNEQKTYYI